MITQLAIVLINIASLYVMPLSKWLIVNAITTFLEQNLPNQKFLTGAYMGTYRDHCMK